MRRIDNIIRYIIITVALSLCAAVQLVSSSSGTLKGIPGRPHRSYVRLGDVNIGSLFSISQYSTTSLCGDKIRFPLIQEFVEAIVYAMDAVNNDSSLLPHVKLGFVMLDDCAKEATAVSQALRFLPVVAGPVTTDDDDNGSTATNVSLDDVVTDNTHYDVIGVIGPLKSSNSIAVSYLLGPAQIPQVSFLATSDELSAKEKHPYFLRLVPPDQYQMRAIVKFIVMEGWTYFSVLYASGSYGELAFRNIRQYAKNHSLCVATEHKLFPTTSEFEYRGIIKDLLAHSRARVVILISGDDYILPVFTAVHRMNAQGKFIWIGTDAWADRFSNLPTQYADSLVGSLTTSFYAPTVPQYNHFFRTLKPSTSKNPWFSEFWERQFYCSFKDKTCDENQDITDSEGFTFLSGASYAIDSVYVYAHALHRLLSERCPLLTGKDVRECVTGDVFLQYLKNVSFTGYTGHVLFDKLGNRQGKYVLKQTHPGNPLTTVPVKIFDVLEFYDIQDLSPIFWDFVKPLDNGFGPNARFPPTAYPVKDKRTPLSVCSRLCVPGEQIVYKEQTCCWECRKCRENERLVDNRTKCQRCPEFYWPDHGSNFTKCLAIDPYYPDLSEIHVSLIVCVSVLGIASSSIVIFLYVKHREVRVIKASSRELSYLQLSAILLGYTTILIYVATPTPVTCSAAFYMFCLSFNWLYAPLLVKTIRIYRIFDSGRKGTRPLIAVSPLSQVLISSAIIFGQIVICIVISFVSPPTSGLTHRIRTEKYIELSCDFTTMGFSSFLAYNLTLILLCSVFAFKTRKLPTNFNESRFISMCVSTTLVMWLAFIPAYMTSSREYLKSLYLSLSLVLNHSVALIFLFLTRLYAVYYVDEADTTDTRAAVTDSNVSPFRARTRNSVCPVVTAPPTPIPTLSSNHQLVPGFNNGGHQGNT